MTFRAKRRLFVAKLVSNVVKAVFYEADFSARSAIFLCLFSISSACELTNKEKLRCAQKIPPSGKQPLLS